ncbi:GNAT family N-acetyltransferase [Pseudomonas syringae]|nr:GNAT family N-acetyltransferase [Pseudomonas syringae]MBD8803202.1 GNAT family N-acetyltransferase [Pseudomonas syringae]MBD8814022.1 GNAT family N-acetyltransferase [Pseudomonas syringae]
MALSAPVKLNEQHDFSEFECSEPSIDEYLKKRALAAQIQKHAVVYVACFHGTNKVAAFYTLSNGSVPRDEIVPKKLQRNSPDFHPVTILGRMGVTKEAQGQGFARDLLHDALSRALIVSDAVGSAAILVHPLTERLAEFYGKAGFIRNPDLSPLTMMLSLRR